MAINIKADSLREGSNAYPAIFNDDGLQVYALKGGRFEIKCGSTRTYAHSMQEISDKVNALPMNIFARTGSDVTNCIMRAAGNQYRLEVCASHENNDEVMHSIEGSRQHIVESMRTLISTDINEMVPGRRYTAEANMYGGDYVVLVPMDSVGFPELSPSLSPNQLYETQLFTKGQVLVGVEPTTGEAFEVYVEESYPNGTFKTRVYENEFRIFGQDDVIAYQFQVKTQCLPEEAEDFRDPDTSLYVSQDIPSYNPVGDVQKSAPMLNDLTNYDIILNSSASILDEFMKTAKHVAMLDRSSLNKISISSIDGEGNALDGSIEWNVRLASPHYRRASLITIPMTMVAGNMELGREFITSTGHKIPLTVESINEHLGSFAEDDFVNTRQSAKTFPSVIKADTDVDALLEGVDSEAESVNNDVVRELGYNFVDGKSDEVAKAISSNKELYIKIWEEIKNSYGQDKANEFFMEMSKLLASKTADSDGTAQGPEIAEVVEDLIEIDKPLDAIPGGGAETVSPSEVNEEQLLDGTEVEMEHTDNPEIAAEIAMDHQVESPAHDEGYYDELEDMEEGLEERAEEIDSGDTALEKEVLPESDENTEAEELEDEEEEDRKPFPFGKRESKTAKRLATKLDALKQANGDFDPLAGAVPELQPTQAEVAATVNDEAIAAIDAADGVTVTADANINNLVELIKADDLVAEVRSIVGDSDYEDGESGTYLLHTISEGIQGIYQLKDAMEFFGVEGDFENQDNWDEVDDVANNVANKLTNFLPNDINAYFYFDNIEGFGDYGLMIGWDVFEQSKEASKKTAQFRVFVHDDGDVEVAQVSNDSSSQFGDSALYFDTEDDVRTELRDYGVEDTNIEELIVNSKTASKAVVATNNFATEDELKEAMANPDFKLPDVFSLGGEEYVMVHYDNAYEVVYVDAATGETTEITVNRPESTVDIDDAGINWKTTKPDIFASKKKAAASLKEVYNVDEIMSSVRAAIKDSTNTMPGGAGAIISTLGSGEDRYVQAGKMLDVEATKEAVLEHGETIANDLNLSIPDDLTTANIEFFVDDSGSAVELIATWTPPEYRNGSKKAKKAKKADKTKETPIKGDDRLKNPGNKERTQTRLQPKDFKGGNEIISDGNTKTLNTGKSASKIAGLPEDSGSSITYDEKNGTVSLSMPGWDSPDLSPAAGYAIAQTHFNSWEDFKKEYGIDNMSVLEFNDKYFIIVGGRGGSDELRSNFYDDINEDIEYNLLDRDLDIPDEDVTDIVDSISDDLLLAYEKISYDDIEDKMIDRVWEEHFGTDDVNKVGEQIDTWVDDKTVIIIETMREVTNEWLPSISDAVDKELANHDYSQLESKRIKDLEEEGQQIIPGMEHGKDASNKIATLSRSDAETKYPNMYWAVYQDMGDAGTEPISSGDDYDEVKYAILDELRKDEPDNKFGLSAWEAENISAGRGGAPIEEAIEGEEVPISFNELNKQVS